MLISPQSAQKTPTENDPAQRPQRRGAETVLQHYSLTSSPRILQGQGLRRSHLSPSEVTRSEAGLRQVLGMKLQACIPIHRALRAGGGGCPLHTLASLTHLVQLALSRVTSGPCPGSSGP